MAPSPGTFTPVVRHGGYLPVEDHGLIGDGTTAALVGRDGAVSWLCAPRFDSPPLFCTLLDARRGGSFVVAPEDLVESRQRYEPDTGVLVTELRGRDGLVRVTDALTLRPDADLHDDAPVDRGELHRSVTVLDGTVRLVVDVAPRGGAAADRLAGGLQLVAPGHRDLDLRLVANRPLDGLRSRYDLRSGDRLDVALRWGPGGHRRRAHPSAEILEGTVRAWRRWADDIAYDGPHEAAVRRSAVTLKLLDHAPNGAVVAAPTSSLPEYIGGPRNWDYRYSWVRDAAFSVYAFRRIGLTHEAWGFLGWVLDALERAGSAHVLYDVDGALPPVEREDPDLEGHRGSSPVRWGNAADDQTQNDAYGEILDCAHQWVAGGGAIDDHLWGRLRPLVERAAERWREPDHGIWEVRSSERAFTYSAAMCQVALDRGARLAERCGLPAPTAAWRREAQRITQAVLDEAWDPSRRSLTEHLTGGGLDASLLALPLRRLVRATHPRMVATTEAIARELGAGHGLLYRYRTEVSPDGIAGGEGAFLLCSFWLVDNLALQGRLDEAMALFDDLCRRGGALGLLPEQVDPSTGGFLGNYPQAFSHVGLISSAVNLVRCLQRSGDRAPAGG